ncbi:hypothetical protein [Streptomyces sp. NPDC003480]
MVLSVMPDLTTSGGVRRAPGPLLVVAAAMAGQRGLPVPAHIPAVEAPAAEEPGGALAV